MVWAWHISWRKEKRWGLDYQIVIGQHIVQLYRRYEYTQKESLVSRLSPQRIEKRESLVSLSRCCVSTCNRGKLRSGIKKDFSGAGRLTHPKTTLF